MSTANDFMTRFKARHSPPRKKRKPVKQQLREERLKTIDEAIQKLRDEMRSKPKQWHRGYNSAITQLELMKS